MVVGYQIANDMFDVSIGTFNGETKENGKDDIIDTVIT